MDSADSLLLKMLSSTSLPLPLTSTSLPLTSTSLPLTSTISTSLPLTSSSLPLTSPDFAWVETSTSAEAAGEDVQSIGEGLPILLTYPRITFLARF